MCALMIDINTCYPVSYHIVAYHIVSYQIVPAQ